MTAGIHRKPPPKVRQTMKNSCWAATLESWSRADSRIPTVTEAQMLHDFNPEGSQEGGINGDTVLDSIKQRFGFKSGKFTASQFEENLLEHLPHSHIFCTIRLEAGSHALLIYRLSGPKLTTVSYMDPDGGYYGFATLKEFGRHTPLAMMWK
jgi:hypothetical protein